MRQFVIGLFVTVLLAIYSSAFAGVTTLAWDPSPSPDVAGYILYYDNDGQEPWAYNVDVKDVLAYSIPDLAPGTWYFTVTAYNGAGQSVGSNVVNDNIPVFVPPFDVVHTPAEIPGAPGTLTITIRANVVIQ